MRNTITVITTVAAPIDKVWPMWNDPAHVTKWNQASTDWHSPHGENNLKPGGRFMYRMEARDGSFGLDFGGIYDDVVNGRHIAYTMDDGRKVQVNFTSEENGDVTISESFEAEDSNPPDMQQAGWQAILDSFKNYVEAQVASEVAPEQSEEAGTETSAAASE